MEQFDASLIQAADAIQRADALLIGAGAGMGVDSGLPDFRGDEGFWKAYPPFRGRSFPQMSNPHWFHNDPDQAWGFFGHRMNLYRDSTPHAGFAILKRWGERLPLGYFVFTSNVDGHFQKAGFEEHRIVECHGSIHFMQCANICESTIWGSGHVKVDVDMTNIRARSTLPTCPQCNGVARPNILMFGDGEWISDRTEEQEMAFRAWLASVRNRNVVAVEIGAGLAIPTVRHYCEHHGKTLIRINVREAGTREGGISLPMKAFEALTQIELILAKAGW